MNFKDELNKKQYEAVSSNEKYLRIIAGAGSGKTRVLTYRIAYLISVFDVDPRNILAITFTNKVANEMKERTISLLPELNGFNLNISTFHSWCAKFLRYEISNALDFPSSYQIIDDEDQLKIIKEIALEHGKRKNDDIVKQALSFISYQKTLGNLPSDVELIKNTDTEKECLDYFKEYEARKNKVYALDFDDLLIYSIRILKNNENIRRKYQNKYKHILIDEFQDTNDTQFELLRLLCNQDTNVYVVGDPDQTIYTWRGANQKIILDFELTFHPLKSIVLNENYRSTTSILNIANKLIKNNKERINKDLFTNQGQGKAVIYRCLKTGAKEGEFIANTISDLKFFDDNLKYNDVAILYRSSYLSVEVEKALTAKCIPYKVYGGVKFYSRKEIKDCIAYFKLLLNEKDDLSFKRIINVPRRGIGEITENTLIKEAKSQDQSMIEYIKNIHRFDSEIKTKNLAKLNSLIEKLDSTRVELAANDEAYSEILDKFLANIDYYTYLNEIDENNEKVGNVRALITDIRNFLKNNPDSTFVDYLQNVMLLTSQDEMGNTDNVNLMTIHTAKGLEFNYVFVIGLSEGVFPNKRALESMNNVRIEEERRLAYVAFTRAKKELYLTCNLDYNYSMGCPNVQSRFLVESGLFEKRIFTKVVDNSFKEHERIYKYDINNRGNVSNIFKNDKIIDLNKKDNGTWNIGDSCNHKKFGEGVVIEVKGDLVVINFTDYGVKTLMGNHSALSKGEKK